MTGQIKQENANLDKVEATLYLDVAKLFCDVYQMNEAQTRYMKQKQLTKPTLIPQYCAILDPIPALLKLLVQAAGLKYFLSSPINTIAHYFIEKSSRTNLSDVPTTSI